jgi:transposase
MDIVHPRCGGIDVHKKRITAWRLVCCESSVQTEEGRFGTHTSDLKRLAQWFAEWKVSAVAMESTGPYWRPVWNVLEAQGLSLTLANPAHIRAIPGHKTDRHDARWIAELHCYGLVPASFVPDPHQRELRDLTRMRTKTVQDHSRIVCRLQAVLEDANIKLDSVVSDILGVSARQMLEGLIEGHSTPEQLADRALLQLRRKLPELKLALEGNFTRHHAAMTQRLLLQERYLRQQQNWFEQAIRRRLSQAELAAMALWDTIPGVNEMTAAVLAAELGVRPEQFPDARHAASWVAVCPGNHESAGKLHSGKMRKGNPWLRTALVQAAWAAARTKDTYLAALYRRLVARKGPQRALMAVAHSILISAYQMQKTGQPYVDLGPDHFQRLHPQRTAHRLVTQLQHLGLEVSIKPVPAT